MRETRWATTFERKKYFSLWRGSGPFSRPPGLCWPCRKRCGNLQKTFRSVRIFETKLMKSPFPGMDPYLEQFWPDIHASLIIYSRDQLEEQLPGSLIARVEERVVVEAEEEPRG